LLGEFGAGPLAASAEFFRRGLVHLVASDAHSLARRPPRLAAARRRVRREWGEEVEVGIFDSNPMAVIRSRPLPWRGLNAPAPPEERPAGPAALAARRGRPGAVESPRSSSWCWRRSPSPTTGATGACGDRPRLSREGSRSIAAFPSRSPRSPSSHPAIWPA